VRLRNSRAGARSEEKSRIRRARGWNWISLFSALPESGGRKADLRARDKERHEERSLPEEDEKAVTISRSYLRSPSAFCRIEWNPIAGASDSNVGARDSRGKIQNSLSLVLSSRTSARINTERSDGNNRMAVLARSRSVLDAFRARAVPCRYFLDAVSCHPERAQRSRRLESHEIRQVRGLDGLNRTRASFASTWNAISHDVTWYSENSIPT